MAARHGKIFASAEPCSRLKQEIFELVSIGQISKRNISTLELNLKVTLVQVVEIGIVRH